MSLNTQAKILRILQEQKFERVGGNKTINVNVRVLAATNKNIEEEIEAGNFRADLFWRLNVVPIHVPKLCDRLEDIPMLVDALMKLLVSRGGVPHKKFTPDSYQALMEHQWPGNVRELRNFIERLAIMCQEPTITALQIRMFLNSTHVTGPVGNGSTMSPFLAADYKTAKRLFEKEFLQQKLLQNENNISKTAEQVGLERSHLHKKLKSFEII